MRKNIAFTLGVGTSLLLVALAAWPLTWQGNLGTLIGRTHPLIVHFPIVGILVTLLLQLGHSRNLVNTRVVSWSYILTLVSLLTSVLVGAILLSNGDYAGDYITKHQWLGTAMTVLWIWSTYCWQQGSKNRAPQMLAVGRGLLYGSVLLTFYVGHLGGSITHGPEYLTEPLAQMKLKNRLGKTMAYTQPKSMAVFPHLILPILEAKCNKCHNSANSKGGLNMEDYQALSAGGKSGAPAISAGDTLASELLVRVKLPPSDDEFMPPDGRSPLTEAEQSLIQWWILAGASATDTLGDGPQDSLTQLAIEQYLQEAAMAQLMAEDNRNEIKRMGPKLTQLGDDLGLKIIPDRAYDSLLYTISMDIPAQIVTDDQLRQLVPYAHLFSSASLVSADISDEGLYHIGKMKNLRKLILAKCCLRGQGLHYLTQLPHLEILNLSYSDVTDDQILSLLQIPTLKEVYLFNSFVSPELITTMDSHLKDCQVLNQEGPYY